MAEKVALVLGGGGTVGFVDRLLGESYKMACEVFDQCWDGKKFEAGHYHLSAEDN